MELKYKALNISKAETKTGKSLFNAMSDLGDNMSVSTLMFMLEAGGLSEDQASDYLDNHSIEETMLAVFDAMTESGFLAKRLKTKEMEQAKEELRKAIKASQNTDTSKTTGETKK